MRSNVRRRGLTASLLSCALSLVCITASADSFNLETLVFYPQPISATPSQADGARMLSALGGKSLLAAGADAAGMERYRERIRQLELEQGVYAPELFQQLLGLGQLQQSAGLHEEALATLQRASQLSRINQGLYSEDQIRLTQAIVDTMLARGMDEEVEAQLERLVSLSIRQYGPDRAQTALAMKGLGEWKLQSYVSNLREHGDTYLVPSRVRGDLFTDYEVYSTNLEELYDAQRSFLDAIRVLVGNEAFGDPELYELEDNLLFTYYLNANREWMLQGNSEIWQHAGRDADSIETALSEQGLPDDYRKGLDSYRRQLGYLKNNPATTYGQLTATMLALADWYQLFEQTDKAREQHARIRAMLARAGLDEAGIAELMKSDEAVVLPVFMQTPLSAKSFDSNEARGYIDVAISQNAAGRVTRADVTGASCCVPEDLQQHLLSLVRNSRFRIRDAAAGSAIRYYYDY